MISFSISFIVVCIWAFACVLRGEVEYKDLSVVKIKSCAGDRDSLRQIERVLVSNCPNGHTGKPCILKRGHNSTIVVKFIPNHSATTLKSDVKGIIYGLELPYPASIQDPCRFERGTCATLGVPKEFTARIPVLPLYPTVNVNVKWTVLNEKNQKLFCFVLPAQVS